MNQDSYITLSKLKLNLSIPKFYKGKHFDDLLELVYECLSQSEIRKILKPIMALMNEEDSKREGYRSREMDQAMKELFGNYRVSGSTWDFICGYYFKNDPFHFDELFKNLNSLYNQKSKKKKKISTYERKLLEVKKTFNLDDKECEILTYFYICEVSRQFKKIHFQYLDLNSVMESTEELSIIFDVPVQKIQMYLSENATLMRTGLIAKSVRRNEVTINSDITNYLSGFSDKNLLECFLNKIEYDDALSLIDHRINENNIKAVKNLMDSEVGTNIIVFGAPGTGKTEFSKSLAKELNRELYFISQKDDEGRESDHYRRTSIVAAINLLNPQKDILVVDECDEIINLKSNMLFFGEKVKDKSWINDLLESSNQKIIWITNRVNGIDDSTKRRFSYALEFSDFTNKQREQVWHKQIKSLKIDFLDHEMVEDLSKAYQINPGSISLTLRDVKAAQLKTDAEKISLLKELLQQHQKFIFGKAPEINLNQKYSLEVLNTDQDLSQVINTCQRFYEMTQVQDKPLIQNMNILLQGSPGTGKTEFVKYLSQKLKRELIIKRQSDIRSPWYGQSLINIAQMFKEAQSKESILFLDEADTFFMPRESSHQFYTSETNELLTQMENFKGILICATNFSTNMDQASMRRFNYKIRFDYLSNQSKILLFEKIFGLGSLTQEQITRLHRIPALTPGDFKVVMQKNFFDENKNIDKLISELEVEVKYKKEITKTVGLV